MPEEKELDPFEGNSDSTTDELGFDEGISADDPDYGSEFSDTDPRDMI